MSGDGAGNRVRTGDLNLGKVALYQLSYSRMCRDITAPRGSPEPARLGAPGYPPGHNLDKVALYQLSYSREVLILAVGAILGIGPRVLP